MKKLLIYITLMIVTTLITYRVVMTSIKPEVNGNTVELTVFGLTDIYNL